MARPLNEKKLELLKLHIAHAKSLSKAAVRKAISLPSHTYDSTVVSYIIEAGESLNISKEDLIAMMESDEAKEKEASVDGAEEAPAPTKSKKSFYYVDDNGLSIDLVVKTSTDKSVIFNKKA